MDVVEADVVSRRVVEQESAGPGSGRGVVAHLAVYALLLVALVAFMRLNTAWSVDEGLYVYQVRALEQGDWDLGYWAESIDPEGRWFPLNRHQTSGDSYFPFVKSPAYPLLMYGATRLLGDTIGLHLLPLLGALGAAAAAWLLASQVDRRAAPVAFWVAALGPVVVNAYAVWAHAPSAAIAGLTTYAAIRVVRNGLTAGRLAAVGVGVTAGVLLRTEGLLFAAALTVVVGAVGGLRLLFRAPRAGQLLCLAATVGAVGLGTNVLEHQWIVAIMGDFGGKSDYFVGGETPYLAGKLEGARHVVVGVNYFEGRGTLMTSVKVLVTLAATVIAGLALRRASARGRVVAIGAMGVVAALVLLRFAGAPDTAPGIVPAWPVAIIGLVLFTWRAATLVERVLAGLIAVEVLATLATQYPEGGAIEWGARYLSPLYPLIAAVAALALYQVLRTLPADTTGRLSRFMVVVLALLPAAAGLHGQRGLRTALDPLMHRIEDAPGVVITSDEWLPQVAYRTYPEHKWLRVEVAEIPAALTRLSEAGHENVIVFQPLDAWAPDPSRIPGGFQVREVRGVVVYLTQN